MSTHPLCSTCSSIDHTAPCHGPEYEKNGSSFSTHLFYLHHNTVNELELCVRVSGCTICRLILATIKDYEVANFKDNWEYMDLLLEEALSEFDEVKVSDSLRERDTRVFATAGADKIHPDRVDASIMLEVTFRKPLCGESEHRTTDITMHWTDEPSGSRQSTTGAILVTGLSGTSASHAACLTVLTPCTDEMNAFLSSRELVKDSSTGSPRPLNWEESGSMPALPTTKSVMRGETLALRLSQRVSSTSATNPEGSFFRSLGQSNRRVRGPQPLLGHSKAIRNADGNPC